jgi:autotransporter-associated beta strand protein
MMPDSTVPWSGDLDEVAYYPAALTLAQVQAHYANGTNASRPLPYQDAVLADAPAGYWRLGEGPFVPRSPLPVAANGGKLEAWTPASGSLLNPSGLIPNYPFVNNAWGFVCVTGNAARATLYFDGVQAATWAGNASLGTSTFLFNIGGGITTPSGDYFLGEIDEVAVFDQAFSAGRVRTHHDTALGGVPVELTDAPTIVPGDSVPEGQRYTLTAASPLRGSGPFTYRWFADDVAIPGATGKTYTVASAVVPAGGGIRYAVEIDNEVGDPVLSPDTYVAVSPMLVWDGRAAANPIFWDVGTTANWVRPAGGAAVAYDDTFGVLFNDAAASGTVAIQADVAPPTLVFDNASLPYTVSSAVEGVGITGSGALTKNGPGTVTLAGNHTFAGGAVVNAGLLKVGDGTTGSLAGAITLAGGNLDLNLPAAANTDRVRVYVPRGSDPKLFGRLKVTVP